MRLEEKFVINVSPSILKVALAGLGLACMFKDQIQKHLGTGQLVQVLDNWCLPFPRYRLYYPSRRQPTPAFAMLAETLRYRG